MKAMILAAGVGTRLDPLTMQLPKPLVPVANIPVMHHILRLLSDHGFTSACANLHYLPNMIKEYFQNNEEIGIKINYLFEEQLSGDAGGVRACSAELQDETFLVIMGDLLTNIDLSYVIAQHKAKGALATIALKAVQDVSQLGVAIIDKDGWIKAFQEKPAPSEARSNLASTGVYILEPAIFDYIPRSGVYGFGKQLFPDLLAQNLPVLGVEVDCYWSDVGTLEKYRQSNFDALAEKIKVVLQPKLGGYAGAEIWAAKNARIESNCLIEGKLLLGNNSIISQGANISGHVLIGDNCIIENGAVIQDTIIWAGSHIGRNAKITNSVIGLNSKIEADKCLNDTVFVTPTQPNSKDRNELLCK